MALTWTRTKRHLKNHQFGFSLVSKVLIYCALAVPALVFSPIVIPIWCISWLVQTTLTTRREKQKSRVAEQFRLQNSRIYKSLDRLDKDGSFRLVEIAPGHGSEKLECRLHISNWRTSQYEALSYCWGDPTPCHQILMNGLPFGTANELHNALLHLRYPDKPRFLWVDAMCINQEDDKEKSQQIRFMREIYRSASNTIVWLGECPDEYLDNQERVYARNNSHHLISSLVGPERFATKDWTYTEAIFLFANSLQHAIPSSVADQRRDLVAGLSMDESLSDPVRSLSDRPWWTRMWTLQELVVSRNITIQVDKYSIEWEKWCFLMDSVNPVNMLSPSNLYGALKRSRDDYQRNEHVGGPDGLLELLYMFRHKECTQKPDMLYALLGLVRPQDCFVIPDTTKSFQVVFRDFIKGYINHYGSLVVLDTIGLCIAPYATSHWEPSWTRIRDRDDAPRSFWRSNLIALDPGVENRFGKIENDVLVEVPWGDSFSASGGIPALDCTFASHDDIVVLHGFVHDTIAALAGEWECHLGDEKGYFKEWESFAEKHITKLTEGSKPYSFADFVRTLTCGTFDSIPETPQDESQYVLFRRYMRAACRHRKFFVTKRGYFGLCDADCLPGDSVCVLLGADVPFILRETQHYLDEESNPVFVNNRQDKKILQSRLVNGLVSQKLSKFMGEAYVDDIMEYNGDIKADMERGSLQIQKFYFWS
ncbi:heterokaryon incompatibility [Fusarium longipes]|uniref:Heterokaryon incompatibility n=1 Tax=Fusarium longipes TaxID=694270 RepID=A0A395S0W1_9HYPO|nr:heterokaryon incompatibility [Fusarium longipes]